MDVAWLMDVASQMEVAWPVDYRTTFAGMPPAESDGGRSAYVV
jgi:hypothetical protein